jgi:thiosulfate/3-mercaptopyruvate sulfurtransferase
MSTARPFPNGQLLFTPEQLHGKLGDEKLTILDVRPTHELVQHGWVPGAAHFDLYGNGITRTTPELFEEWINLMRSLAALRGVALDRTVVIYEETSGNRAARLFWVLEYLGHEDVHVLDGGFGAWRGAGLPVSREMREPKARSFKPKPRPELFISADELNRRLREPGLSILDTRSDDEYYSRHIRSARGGAIPGAVHLEWTNYLDDSGRFKPYPELLALFASRGIRPENAIVPY